MSHPNRHHRILATVMASIAFAAVTSAEEGGGEVTVEELRATITNIVEVQTQASRELRDWETRKATMADLLDVHRREIELLTQELETSGRSAPGHAEAVQSAENEIAALRDTRAQLTAAVQQARPRLLALAERFPQPLAKDAREDLAALTAWEPGDEPREALQPLLGILTKAGQFNRRFTRAFAVIQDREVQVLYLGLTRAFYADRSGNAGIGIPTAQGWEWQADPALNRQILRAFDILDQKRPPTRVELPLHIE